MGVDLQDTYGAKIRGAILSDTTDKWYAIRDSVFKKVRKICPYYVIYSKFPTSMGAVLGTDKSLEAIWCEENLRGRFYGLLQEELDGDRHAWLVRFEFEEDAVFFKLTWG